MGDILTSHEFTNEDLGFSSSREKCALRFSFRSSGAPRCRLVFDRHLSEVLRERSDYVFASVDGAGNILVSPVRQGLSLSQDGRAWVSLDRYAAEMYEMHGGDVEYDRLILAGGMTRVVLAPSSAQASQWDARMGDTC